MPYVLDTDLLTALQHNHPAVVARVAVLPPSALFVTIVSFEEQIAGRLHVLHGMLGSERLVEAYQRLGQTLQFFAAAHILMFDAAAARQDDALRQTYRRMGTKDRRIAAIALVNQCILVTRNTVHFQNIAGLRVEDWMAVTG